MSERIPLSPLLALAALVVVAAGIKAAEQVMVPFLLAAFIATIAATPVFWLQRHRLPVGLAITVVVLALIAVLVGFGAIVAESADAFRERLPFYQERAVALLEPVLAFLGGLGIELSPELLDPGPALGFAGDALGSLGSVLTNSFFILLAVVFILTRGLEFPAQTRNRAQESRAGSAALQTFRGETQPLFRDQDHGERRHRRVRRGGAVAIGSRLPDLVGAPGLLC